MIKNKVKIRVITFLILSLLAYGFTIFYLFGSHDVLGSIVCIFFLFIFFHFMSLDIKKFKKRYVLLTLLSLLIITISIFFIFSWETNFWLILSLVLLNASLYALFTSLKVINFTSIGYFLRGGYIFTLLITITYSVALIGMFKKFPFTCEGLQNASNKLIEFVETPFKFSVDKFDTIKSTGSNEEKLSTVFIENQDGVMILGDNTSGENKSEAFDTEIQSVLLKAKNTEILPDPGNDLSPIIWQFNEWKASAVDQIMNQQESYSSGMCDMLLEEINSKYNLNEFKLSVILLSYLLLYGFVRVAIFIMSLIGFLSFKILYWLGFYKIEKVKKLVKEIK